MTSIPNFADMPLRAGGHDSTPDAWRKAAAGDGPILGLSNNRHKTKLSSMAPYLLC